MEAKKAGRFLTLKDMVDLYKSDLYKNIRDRNILMSSIPDPQEDDSYYFCLGSESLLYDHIIAESLRANYYKINWSYCSKDYLFKLVYLWRHPLVWAEPKELKGNDETAIIVHPYIHETEIFYVHPDFVPDSKTKMLSTYTTRGKHISVR